MRVFKTRALATDACRAGSVEVNELAAKPAREVHAGEIVTVRQGLFTRTLRVGGVPRSRVGAKLLPEYCVDLTPPEEYERLRERDPARDAVARWAHAHLRRAKTNSCNQHGAMWHRLTTSRRNGSCSPSPTP